MKIDAHPLVVAVALGLLGPGVLLREEEEREEPCEGCPDHDHESEYAPTTAQWEPGEAPDPEEFHRVEIEWLKQTKT
jgi:hypothetical protein